jgi:molybdenum cofactor cytidylyltransferase
MGAHKLLLPLGGQTVIRRLLDVLQRSEITDRVVVTRADDEPLQREVERSGGSVVRPAVDPPDMRASVQYALDAIRDRHAPSADDAWLLVPADHPLLEPAVLDLMLEHWGRGRDSILIPTFAGWRGHPALFRWKLAALVPTIPAGRGLNWLLENGCAPVAELPVEDESILLDLDTPEDLETARRRY